MAEREELATALPMVAPLNAFPFCSPQGPLQAHCAKSGKPLPLFFTPLSASKLATGYKTCEFYGGEGGIGYCAPDGRSA